MEQILNKLSEIELTAQRIMEDCDRQKQQLSEEAEQKCKNYDRQLESRTAEQIRRKVVSAAVRNEHPVKKR